MEYNFWSTDEISWEKRGVKKLWIRPWQNEISFNEKDF